MRPSYCHIVNRSQSKWIISYGPFDMDHIVWFIFVLRSKSSILNLESDDERLIIDESSTWIYWIYSSCSVTTVKYNKSFKYKLKCVLFHFSRATIWNGCFRDNTWICYWFDIVGSLFREPRFATWYWDEFSINLNPPIGKVVSKFINGGSPKFIWTYNWFKMDFEKKPFKIENFRVFVYEGMPT